MLLLASWFCVIWVAESAVLDPALYLSPSPPLHDEPILWSQKRIQRNAHDLSIVPLQYVKLTPQDPVTTLSPLLTSSTSSVTLPSAPSTTVTPNPDSPTTEEMMEKAETFWPGLGTSGPYFGIHVPLSFSLSGTYGRYGTGSPSVITTSYVSSNKDRGIIGLYGNTGLYGKSGLAGSSYGSYSGYGTRIYGSDGGAAWSGWGNGKWGHYGKG